mmetsp:Transcript_13892/g.23026  ORF Transcript_13892/g.23026 Transcript_13892/m.23026 type:complete len:80 (-) Transcript_13892:366-605(-)
MARWNAVRVMTEGDIVDIASHSFWRLEVLQELGIMHRDVKPSNILSGGESQAFLLCDYGAALSWKSGDEMGIFEPSWRV